MHLVTVTGAYNESGCSSLYETYAIKTESEDDMGPSMFALLHMQFGCTLFCILLLNYLCACVCASVSACVCESGVHANVRACVCV